MMVIFTALLAANLALVGAFSPSNVKKPIAFTAGLKSMEQQLPFTRDPSGVIAPRRSHILFMASNGPSVTVGKKILLCLDGTGDKPENALNEGFGITNVLKLHLLAGGSIDNKGEAIPGQRSLYYTGIGTRSRFKFVNTLRYFLALRGPGIVINECKRDLKTHFEKGDQLYIFGFSRGSATARLLASELGKKGFEGKDGFVEGKDVPITLLGVWDTVADFGLPNFRNSKLPSSRKLHEDGVVSPAVDRVLHLMALDDPRVTFYPTPVGDVDNDIRREIWFPGTHSGVGGGWNNTGLSDASCQFMIRAASNDLPPDRCLRFLKPQEVGKGSLYDSKRDFSLLDTSLELTPNCLDKLHDVSDFMRSHSRPAYLAHDNEPIPASAIFVHESVIKRAEGISDYRPPNLERKLFRVVYSDGSTSEKVYNGLQELLQDADVSA